MATYKIIWRERGGGGCFNYTSVHYYRNPAKYSTKAKLLGVTFPTTFNYNQGALTRYFCIILERLRFPFTANGKRQVPVTRQP